jgi:hypothetical protein
MTMTMTEKVVTAIDSPDVAQGLHVDDGLGGAGRRRVFQDDTLQLNRAELRDALGHRNLVVVDGQLEYFATRLQAVAGLFHACFVLVGQPVDLLKFDG